MSRIRTVHVIVHDDVDPDLLATHTDFEVTRQLGTIHIVAQPNGPQDVYALLDRLRVLGVTLISLRVELLE